MIKEIITFFFLLSFYKANQFSWVYDIWDLMGVFFFFLFAEVLIGRDATISQLKQAIEEVFSSSSEEESQCISW